MKTFKRSEGIFFAEVQGEFFLTLENKDVVVCLNQAAFSILENLDGFTSVDVIKKQFARITGLESKRADQSISKIIDTLLELGVIAETEQGGSGKKQQIYIRAAEGKYSMPEVIKSWAGKELAGGMFVNSADGDIHVIVPNVTDGPIKTCPPNTCTIPAGLFSPETIIRTFDQNWRKNFEGFRRFGLGPMIKKGV